MPGSSFRNNTGTLATMLAVFVQTFALLPHACSCRPEADCKFRLQACCCRGTTTARPSKRAAPGLHSVCRKTIACDCGCGQSGTLPARSGEANSSRRLSVELCGLPLDLRAISLRPSNSSCGIQYGDALLPCVPIARHVLFCIWQT